MSTCGLMYMCILISNFAAKGKHILMCVYNILM